jgi:hypothetical protein
MHISAKETWQRIRQLKPEFGSYGALALHLGLKRPILEINHSAVTVRTMLRVRRVHRLLTEGTDCAPDA